MHQGLSWSSFGWPWRKLQFVQGWPLATCFRGIGPRSRAAWDPPAGSADGESVTVLTGDPLLSAELLEACANELCKKGSKTILWTTRVW